MKRGIRDSWRISTPCARLGHNHSNTFNQRFISLWPGSADLPSRRLLGGASSFQRLLNFYSIRCAHAGVTRERGNNMAVDNSDIDPRPIHSSGSGPRSRIVWVDMEMTGLDPDQHRIVEVSCVITDADLNIVAEAPTLVIYQPSSVLDNMSQWCRDNFSKSGLIEQVKSSLIDLPTADQQLVEFVKGYCEKKCAPLAGNSVWADRMFMAKQLPLFNDHLHYRIIDVSSVKELCKRWYPRDFSHAPKKDLKHRALSDIRESIEELKYYRATIFKQK